MPHLAVPVMDLADFYIACAVILGAMTAIHMAEIVVKLFKGGAFKL